MFSQTGSSSNITFWRDGGVWAEVLTAALHKRNGRWQARRIPRHHVTIYRNSVGEIGRFSFDSRALTARGLSLRVSRFLAA